MLRRNLGWILVVGVLGLGPGLGGCGGSTPAASDPAGAASANKGTSEPDKATDEALAAEIAKDQGATSPGDKAEAQSGDSSPPKTDEARKNQIYGLIKERRAPVLECVKEARKKNPKLGKDLVVTFGLNSDGTFKEPPSVVKDRSDITDPKVIACALDTIKGIKFPAHSKGMESTFTYPYKFDVVRAKQ
jgi:hypothetical protein